MLRKKSGPVEWLEFEIFQEIPQFTHGVFLRHGGYSEGAFSSLNIGRSQGDVVEVVNDNIKILSNILNIPFLVKALQHHGSHLEKATHHDKEIFCDGLFTTEPGVGLLTTHADCQVALIVDPKRKIFANVHSGWRGQVQNIYQKAIEKLKQEKGSQPEDLLVGITPSLGPETSQFIHYRTEFPESFLEFQWKPDYFNLWELARVQLLQGGILPHHIEIASLCTYSNPTDFFSYRREKKSGRHGTLAAWTR